MSEKKNKYKRISETKKNQKIPVYPGRSIALLTSFQKKKIGEKKYI